MKLLIAALLTWTLTLSLGPSKPGPLTVAQTTQAYPPIQCSSDLCIIRNSPGGIVDLYAAQARQLIYDGTPIIIDGPCYSACTILVDIARKNVCLTHNAILGYHKAFIPGTTITSDISYETPGLNNYLKSRGGLPEPSSGRLLLLNFSEANQFYPSCIKGN